MNEFRLFGEWMVAAAKIVIPPLLVGAIFYIIRCAKNAKDDFGKLKRDMEAVKLDISLIKQRLDAHEEEIGNGVADHTKLEQTVRELDELEKNFVSRGQIHGECLAAIQSSLGSLNQLLTYLREEQKELRREIQDAILKR